VCVSCGLKKSRDFTVSEGHEYPLVITMEVNALIFLFTFILDIEKNNVANLIKPILIMMDHYL
jgi:hypothetical protein